ncbi:MAG: hypothetical protein LBH08_02205 [Puniceicoccales bacterium]|nr:hypothetical protein [Puniceicoccales bacterium]
MHKAGKILLFISVKKMYLIY